MRKIYLQDILVSILETTELMINDQSSTEKDCSQKLQDLLEDAIGGKIYVVSLTETDDSSEFLFKRGLCDKYEFNVYNIKDNEKCLIYLFIPCTPLQAGLPVKTSIVLRLNKHEPENLCLFSIDEDGNNSSESCEIYFLYPDLEEKEVK